MSPKDFSNALATVKNQNFDETTLKTAKQIASANCLNVNQIIVSVQEETLNIKDIVLLVIKIYFQMTH